MPAFVSLSAAQTIAMKMIEPTTKTKKTNNMI